MTTHTATRTFTQTLMALVMGFGLLIVASPASARGRKVVRKAKAATKAKVLRRRVAWIRDGQTLRPRSYGLAKNKLAGGLVRDGETFRPVAFGPATNRLAGGLIRDGQTFRPAAFGPATNRLPGGLVRVGETLRPVAFANRR